jgi:hypothetical protein
VTIRATGSVLAAVVEEWWVGGKVNAMAGYNAFGPRDLSPAWSVPVIRRADEYVSTVLAIQNPMGEAASGTVRLTATTGDEVEVHVEVASGGTMSIPLSDEAGFPIGTGRAWVAVDRPVAVVAYEVRDTSREYPAAPLTVVLGDERNSMIEGDAVLTPRGEDLVVAINVSGGNSQNGTYSAYFMESACGEMDSPSVHDLNDVVGGRSTTTLRGVTLRDVADGVHAIRLKRAGGGPFAGRVACGMVPEFRGVEAADSSAAGAIAVEEGPDTLPEPGELPTESPTPTGGATAVPTTPAGTPSPGAHYPRVLLPVAKNRQ